MLFLRLRQSTANRRQDSVSNQNHITFIVTSHSTSALVSEILMSVLQTVQKNNRQFTYGQTVQKKTTNNLHMDRQCKKNCTGAFTVLQTVQKKQQQFTYGQTVQKTTNNLHMDRQCKKQQQFTYGQTVQKTNKKTQQKYQQFTYGQYIFTDCTEDNVQNTHTYTQYA